MHFRTFFLLLPFCFLSLSAFSQPLNDACARAIPLEIGKVLRDQDNRLATINETEVPALSPETCIKTYENDLWYTFTTEPGYTHYRVTVEPFACETPAGLQMLIIKTDTCDPATFDYTLCVNPQAIQTLEGFWENPVPGETYLVHVDGFDGNICGFQIGLEGFNGDPRTENDLRRMYADYGHPEPDFEEAELISSFENNAVTLNWQADSREEIRFFLIEEVIYRPRQNSYNGWVQAVVDPVSSVGNAQMVEYSFTIDKPYIDEKEYCYQVVKVMSDLSRHYSPATCLTTTLIKDFYISEVFEDEQEGVYAIKFINRKKQDLVFSLFDREGTYLKGYTRKREPLQDGRITIDMNEYGPGEYLLVVEGKNGAYRRRFFRE